MQKVFSNFDYTGREISPILLSTAFKTLKTHTCKTSCSGIFSTKVKVKVTRSYLISYGSKVIANVKVEKRQTDRTNRHTQTDGQMDRRTDRRRTK